MIGYPVSKAHLVAAINEIAPTWFSQAAKRTAAYAQAGRYVDPPSSIWSNIKRVYMDLQGYKCGFCERRLERSDHGNVEHDVEHFRPKGKVDPWPPASAPERAEGLTFGLGTPSPLGYYLLAHQVDNYLVSCKTCNSSFKANGFPVEGDRHLDMATPRMTAEQALLVNPIGRYDDNPQDIIRFEGIIPVPAATHGRRRRRGQLIINFFGLAERDGLLLERSTTIAALHLALEQTTAPGTTGDLAQHLVATLTANSAAHANCARSYLQLWNSDQPAARAYSKAALDHLLSMA